MDRMLVVVFDTEDKAYAGKRALAQLDSEGSIAVYADAVIAKNANGSITVKESNDGWGLGVLAGTSLGALIGLLGGPVGLAIGASVGLLTGTIADTGPRESTSTSLTMRQGSCCRHVCTGCGDP